MIDTKQTNLAVQLACQAHRGQTDKAGLPYIRHPLHVAEHMPDELSTIVALLHDVIEDTSMTAEDLRRAGIPARAEFYLSSDARTGSSVFGLHPQFAQRSHCCPRQAGRPCTQQRFVTAINCDAGGSGTQREISNRNSDSENNRSCRGTHLARQAILDLSASKKQGARIAVGICRR